MASRSCRDIPDTASRPCPAYFVTCVTHSTPAPPFTLQQQMLCYTLPLTQKAIPSRQDEVRHACKNFWPTGFRMHCRARCYLTLIGIQVPSRPLTPAHKQRLLTGQTEDWLRFLGPYTGRPARAALGVHQHQEARRPGRGDAADDAVHFRKPPPGNGSILKQKATFENAR